jgi:parallel beta-helix repeat protein
MRLQPNPARAGALAALALAVLAVAGPARAADAPGAAPGAGPAVVRGALAASATWSGTVRVEGPVDVPDGVTLTLQPGTDVRFAPGAALNVAGRLVAEGTAERPISFGPADPALPGEWGRLNFGGLPGGSRLAHCRVLRADALAVSAGAVTLEDCEISGGRTGILANSKGTEVVVLRSRFADLREGGAAYGINAAGRVVASTFERCGPFGISESNGAACEIRENRIFACETGIEIVRSAPQIFDNTVRGCTRGLGLTYVGGGRPISGNALVDNGIGIFCQQFSAPEIRGNTISGGDEGIHCFMGATPLIAGNTVRGAKTGIFCTQMSNPLVEANVIEGNGTGVLLDLSSYAIIRGNNFLGNTVQMELGNMSLDWERRVGAKPSRGRQQQLLGRAERGKAAPGGVTPDGFDMGTGLVDARENWWGDATTREMEEKGVDANITTLVDGYDVPVRVYEGDPVEYLQDKITYAPWLKQPAAGAGAPPSGAPGAGGAGR